jgi:hypothetical protein
MKEENSDNQLKDLFKDKFANEHLAPPKGAWSNIQGKMATPGRIRKPLYYWLIPVGLLFVIGGGIAVNSIFSTEKVQTSKFITEEIEDEKSINEEKNNITDNEIEGDDNESVIASTKTDSLLNEFNVEEENSNSQAQRQTEMKTVTAFNNNSAKPKTLSSANQSQTIAKKEKSTSYTSASQVNSATAGTKKTINQNELNKVEEVSKEVNTINEILKKEQGQTTNPTSVAESSKKTFAEEKLNSTSEKQDKVSENTSKPVVSDIGKIAESNVSKPKADNSDKTTISNSQNNAEETKAKNVINEPKSAKIAESKESKAKELKKPEKEIVAANSEEKKEDAETPKPEVVESNILIHSAPPRNNLRYDFYMGTGKSPRRSTFYDANADNPAVMLADKSVNMNNAVMGFNVRYQITPYFAMRSGIAVGSDRYQSNSFSVKLANTDLTENFKIATVDGVLQTTGLVFNNLAPNGTDSSNYDMNILHRQGYLTIPISFVVNTKIQPGKLYYYGSTGFDFMAKGKGRNILTVVDGETSRKISLARISDVNRIYTNWNLSLGLAFPFQSRFDIFTELNYSLDVSKRLKSSYLNTNSSHIQLLIGMRF